GGYQAEYGRATGGIINVVTKSGGNEFHGSVFVNWSPFEAERRQIGRIDSAISSRVKQNFNLDFGAELGGPILKDRLWFFAGVAPQIVSRNVARIISAREQDEAGAPLPGADGAQVVHEVARKDYAATSTALQFAGKLTFLANEDHSIAFAIYGAPKWTSGVSQDQFGTLRVVKGS